jgi:hypothetical protein
MNWKRWKEGSQPNPVFVGILVEGLLQVTKYLSQDRRHPGRDSNQVHFGLKLGVFLLLFAMFAVFLLLHFFI